MTDRELMQEALYALTYVGDAKEIYSDTIESLRARLAQPEQEPVAWITDGGKGELWWHQSEKFDVDGNLIGENPDDIPLYTAPPQREWQGLTDEEIEKLYLGSFDEGQFAHAIEAKLKEKNHG